MAQKSFLLKILCPDREFLNKKVEMVILRTVDGDMGVLAGHIPTVTILSYGQLRFIEDSQESVVLIMGGFVDIKKDCVTILTDSANWPEEIDVNRAMLAKERAERRLQNETNIDVQRAELALKRSIMRLDFSSLHKK